MKKAHRRVPCEPENENLCGFLLLNHDLTDGTVAHADDVQTLAGGIHLAAAGIVDVADVGIAVNLDGIDGGEDYVAIMHPFVAYDLMRHPEWQEWQKYQNGERLYAREVGRIGKVHIVTTSEAKIWNPGENNSSAASTANATMGVPTYTYDSTKTGYYSVFGTLVLAAHAYGVTELQGAGLEHIMKPLGYGEDPLNQRASVGWKCTLGATRLNEDAMIRIESLSTYSKTAKAN